MTNGTCFFIPRQLHSADTAFRRPLEVLCKKLKGGTGHWGKFSTLREAICEFEKREKLLFQTSDTTNLEH
jgi:hypothetical protein